MANQETEIDVIIGCAGMGELSAGLLLSKAVHYSTKHQTGLHFQESFCAEILYFREKEFLA